MGKTKNGLNINDADKRLQVLFEIANAVNTTTNLSELYKVIHTSLGKVIKVNNIYICKYDQKSDTMVFPYVVDEIDKHQGPVENFSKTQSLTRDLINVGKPIILYEKDLDPQRIIGTAPKTWLGAPLVVKDRVLGAIAIQDYFDENAYHQGDLDILNSVSQHIALALERKENDDTLKEQGEILEKIVESSPVGIALVENRVFKWVNSELVKIYGCENKEELVDKSLKSVYATEDDFHKAGEIIYKECAEKGKADFEYPHVRKDNTVFPAHIIINSADKKNPFLWTIVTITDLSEQKAAELEKIEREKLQGVLEMAGAVCHELSQPLQTILGNSELLMMEDDDTGETKSFEKALDVIIEQAGRIGNITKKLSGITRYKTIDYPGDRKIFDIWEQDQDLKD